MRCVRCVCLGDTCGKTSLLKALLFGQRALPECHNATVLHVFQANFPIKGSDPVLLSILEFGSGCNFESVEEKIYTADVFLVCFSIMAPQTFDRVKRKWVQEIRSLSTAPIILCGTQADLLTADQIASRGGPTGSEPDKNMRPIDRETVMKSIESLVDEKNPMQIPYVETSAFTQAGLSHLIKQVVALGSPPAKKTGLSELMRKLSKRSKDGAPSTNSSSLRISPQDVGDPNSAQDLAHIIISPNGIEISSVPDSWKDKNNTNVTKADKAVVETWRYTKATIESITPRSYRRLRLAMARQPSGRMFHLSQQGGVLEQRESMPLSTENLAILEKSTKTGDPSESLPYNEMRMNIFLKQALEALAPR